MAIERLDEVVAGVGRAIQAGARVYWVCPLVDENEDLDLAAATERRDVLAQFFGDRVGLVHGQMPPNPEILAKTAEMELNGKETESRIASEKAKQVNLYADTWKKLAETDQINGEQPLEWMAQYADLLRTHMDSLMAPAEGQPQQPPAPHPDEIMGGPPQIPPPMRQAPPVPIPFEEPPQEMSFHNAPFARPGGQ